MGFSKAFHNKRVDCIHVEDFVEHYPQDQAEKLNLDKYDFINIQKLTQYLNYLDQNNTAYLEYFKFKTDAKESRKFQQHVLKFSKTPAICQVMDRALQGSLPRQDNLILDRLDASLESCMEKSKVSWQFELKKFFNVELNG